MMAALTLAAASAASAQTPDALYLKSLAATCANCHGTNGKAVDGSSVPTIAGMPRDYLVAQLKAFKADPANKGRTCRQGLWAYSRHPNYFFEWVMWLSYFLLALAAPYGWATFYAPLLMLFFLLKVTGVKYTEEQCLRSRGEEYAKYQREVPMFIPWIPKA
jgi:hypothetical protein